MKLRKEIIAQDRQAIESIVRSTHFFNEEEVAVALELADEKIKLGERSSYQFIMACDDRNLPAGFSCYGKVPGTEASFDLYWIAIAENYRRQGIGKLLLKETEQQIKIQDGVNLYAETSGREQYHPSHQFYIHAGFVLEATLKDFFSTGDDKLIFTKRLI